MNLRLPTPITAGDVDVAVGDYSLVWASHTGMQSFSDISMVSNIYFGFNQWVKGELDMDSIKGQDEETEDPVVAMRHT